MKLYHLKFKKYHINLSNKKKNFSRINLLKLILVNKMGKVYWRISLLCGILGFFPGIFIPMVFPFLTVYSYLFLPGAAIVFGFIGYNDDNSKVTSIAGLILGFIAIFIFPLIVYRIYLSFFDWIKQYPLKFKECHTNLSYKKRKFFFND